MQAQLKKVLAMPNRLCIMASMNKLTRDERGRILHLLCEGNSLRAITRLTGVRALLMMNI